MLKVLLKNPTISTSLEQPISSNNISSVVSYDEAQRLRAEVSELKDTVKRLSDQLSFVLSYLGMAGDKVSDDQNQSLNSAISDFPPLFLSQPLTAPAPAVLTASTSAVAVTGTDYSSVTKKPPLVPPLLSTLKNDVANELISAVYVDLEQKRRRANNIIISGFPVAPIDREGAESFLKVEFFEIASSLKINSCRRLGHRQADRVQPLLVVCSSTEDAQFILNNAKRLRGSGNHLVREHIYINPDLTKAEASAAYELRKRRRAARVKNRQPKPAGEVSSGSTSVTLNLDAAPFQPTTGTSTVHMASVEANVAGFGADGSA